MAKAIDQYWRSIIEYSLVPTTEQLYVVGSFARSVTVYAQQVRAVGLVDSLAGLGRLRKSTRVAVVGGGIAGMTAAAALGKIGMHPQIFEKENTLAQLQRNSGRRYLHPHIYDWPLTSIHDTDAGLPVLNWRAAMASAVVKDLEEQWKDITKGSATIWPEVKKLERTGRHWRVFTGEGSYEFDVVLVCIGFGVESGSYSYPYWADLPLNDPKIHSETWLISGAGDGALTDLMRLCIRNFLHDEALRLVVETVEKTSGAAAIEKLRDRVRERVTGPSLFKELNAGAIAAMLDLRANPVTLLASEADLFGTDERPARSSVLNRLVAWVLIGAGKVKVESGWLARDGISGSRGDYSVRIDGRDAPLACEDVLLRHGPDAPFGRNDKPLLPSWIEKRLERSIKRLAEKWRLLYEERTGADPTICREHWGDRLLGEERLSPDFEKHPGLLIYSRVAVGQSPAFANTIKAALGSKRVKSVLGRSSGDVTKIPLLHLEDALADPRAFGRTIRAVCDAPIVIFDGTVELPSLLFLLGVRSVVRRGITVLVRVGKLDAKAWQKLAFNLRELRIVSVAERSGLATEDQVRKAVEEGLKLYARRPFTYADLPAFDSVRYLGGQKEDYAPRTRNTEVLVLCPFDDDYEENCWPEVQRALRDNWGNGDDPGPARRVIDLHSPELVESQLYGAIRRDAECIADLTLDRPNVFFELGARLVANERGCRVIRCADIRSGDHEVNPPFEQDCRNLDQLVGTRKYNVSHSPEMPIAEAIHVASADWLGGTVTPGYAFAIAQDSVDPRQEAGGRPVELLLWNVIEETVGQDRKQSGMNPALYADGNPVIRAQTLRFAFDALLAYVLFTDSMTPARRDSNKRALAISELDEMIKNLELDEVERLHLSKLLAKLKGQSQ